jgi:hypothetical protein
MQHLAIGQRQVQTYDVRAEATVQVVVLAVHIRRNHAADRYELGAGRHRRKPTQRHEALDDVDQHRASRTGQHAARGIQRGGVVTPQHTDRAFGVYGTITIAAAVAPRNQRW